MTGTPDTKPIIGSYKNPQTPEEFVIEDKRKQVETPTLAMSTGIQEELKQGAKRSESKETKAKTYKEILSDRDVSLDKARSIVDDMLTKGYYEEIIPITKNVTVTLRTRAHGDYIRYLRALEFIAPKFMDEQNEIQQRYFLAASIVAFKGDTFEHPEISKNNSKEVEDAFDVRLKWVEKLPERVVFLLLNKLSSFDQMIADVMSEGVVENF